MSDQSWKDATKLEDIGEVFAGFLDQVKEYKNQWKSWYDEETPEQVPMPCDYTEKLNKFQQLLVCKIFRSDRVVNGVKNFIMELYHMDLYCMELNSKDLYCMELC